MDFSGTPTSGYFPLSVQFTDTSTFVGTNWTWNFGDNFTSTEQNPLHVYTTPGIYTVTLSIMNGTEIKHQTKYDYITVNKVRAKYFVPEANFTYVPLNVNPLSVQFIDQSFSSTNLTYFWTFGDGGSSTEKSPNHTYLVSGNYTVSLTVTDYYSRISTATKNIEVAPVPQPAPVAMFMYSLVNDGTGRTIQFTDQSLNTPVSWFWNFGDNSTSHIADPVHTYDLFGNYTVSLVVSNAGGTSSASQNVILPSPGPVYAGFTYNQTGTRTFTFSDSSSGPILMWVFNFGDGNTISVSNSGWPVQHTYTRQGNFPVTLFVTNGEYNSETMSQNVFVL